MKARHLPMKHSGKKKTNTLQVLGLLNNYAIPFGISHHHFGIHLTIRPETAAEKDQRASKGLQKGVLKQLEPVPVSAR